MKRILPVIFMLITSITVFAQEDTRMLKEGRSWKVLEMFCDQPEYETYTVSGDTVIKRQDLEEDIGRLPKKRP